MWKTCFDFLMIKNDIKSKRFNAIPAMPFHTMLYYNVCLVCSRYGMIRWMTAWNLCSVCIFYNVIFGYTKNVVCGSALRWGWHSYFVVAFLKALFFLLQSVIIFQFDRQLADSKGKSICTTHAHQIKPIENCQEVHVYMANNGERERERTNERGIEK